MAAPMWAAPIKFADGTVETHEQVSQRLAKDREASRARDAKREKDYHDNRLRQGSKAYTPLVEWYDKTPTLEKVLTAGVQVPMKIAEGYADVYTDEPSAIVGDVLDKVIGPPTTRNAAQQERTKLFPINPKNSGLHER